LARTLHAGCLTAGRCAAIIGGEENTKMDALFTLGRRPPTTRDIANTIKEGGTGALTDAEHLADDASYQEVACRSALNRVAGMPFSWTLNPYRGCTHGCHYCLPAVTTRNSR